MDFFKVVSVTEGREKISEVFNNFSFDIREVSIVDSLDKTLVEDIISSVNVPEFNRSTVDGYAIRSSDSHGASDTIPSFLTLIGEVRMGEEASISLSLGEAVYVPTGAMIPQGADAVVMIEHTEKLDEKTIAINKPVSQGENIILKGDDIKIGQVLLESGRVISPHDIGVLAALGVPKVKVFQNPTFYVISTGDEIIDMDEELVKGKIRDINGYALHGLIRKIGGDVIKRTIVKDDFSLLKEEVKKGIGLADIVIISGGSSVGTRDYTYDVINSFEGKGVFIHGISIKPGKPTLVGEAHGKPIFGLPGHPVSSIIIFKAFIEKFIREKMRIKEELNSVRAIITSNLHSSPGKETYQMVTIENRDGKLYAIPNFGKSGMITLLSKSHGYIIIGQDEEGINKGEERDVYFL